jgi:hypothetical protein
MARIFEQPDEFMSSTTKSMHNFAVKIVCIVILVSVVASCSINAQRDAVCNMADRWNAASTAVAEVSVNIDEVSPGRLKMVLFEATETLDTMGEVAPLSIRFTIEKLAETYQSFSDALEQLDWNSSLIDKDSAATSARVRLASDEIESAQSDLGEYIDIECNVRIDNLINQLPDIGSTLPDPVIQDETKELPDVSFDNDASLYNAFGALAIERFGIAVTVEQTTCVGTGLVQRSATNNAQLDARYWTILQKIFDDCLVPINIAEFLSK